jgi:hypothetical protein
MGNKMKNVQFLLGSEELFEKMCCLHPQPIFDERVLDFIDLFSKELRIFPNAAEFPDLAALAFWCRRRNLEQMREEYDRFTNRRGRGWIFQVAPANIPTLFAYSLFTAILAGNSSCLRVTSQPFPQIEIIVNVLKKLLINDFKKFQERMCIVRYLPSIEVNSYFSEVTDGRIIWGGDKTICNVRQSVLNPKAIDLAFPNRHSILLINTKQYLESKQKPQIADRFYRDTYSVHQNACSSPLHVIWHGEDPMDAASNEFWEELRHCLNTRGYKLLAFQTLDKMEALCSMAIKYDLEGSFIHHAPITRVRCKTLDPSQFEFDCGGGFFIEHKISSLKEILPVCTKELQTLLYYGEIKTELNTFFNKNQHYGITRVAPLGAGLEFGLTWDGIDLIEALSIKRVYI